MREMSLFDALLSLLLLVFITSTSSAQDSYGGGGNNSLPSAATLSGCQRTCGNLTFDYPFGIGSRHCFRDTSFELVCNNTTQIPTLYLSDGTTEVVDDLDMPDNGTTDDNFTALFVRHVKIYCISITSKHAPAALLEIIFRSVTLFNFFHIPLTEIAVFFSHSIPTTIGENVYNMSWKAPGRHLTLEFAQLNITGCDFGVYQLLDQEETTPMLLSAVSCPNKEITETVARQNCNGTGCCSIPINLGSNSLQLQFVRNGKEQIEHGERTNRSSSLWDSINITTVFAEMSWTIIDQLTCASTLVNKTNYACAGKYSNCYDGDASPGYNCLCVPGYEGNPYLLDGCKRDEGYNPFPIKTNCAQSCGNISVPFPFGLEEGCSARDLFLLNCTNMSTSSLELNTRYRVTYIHVNDGLVGLEDTSYYRQEMYTVYIPNEPELYVGSGESASMQWAVANLTCQEAQQNKSGYACVSNNSSCLSVNSTYQYIGYRCQCTQGFQGNPYIQNGCADIDECVTTPGILIGLTGGFSFLLLSLSVIFLFRKWKRDIQKQLRRTNFRKNQGLLLEQLISSDENASDKTNIFSLEELEKATNNFDPTRILGHGGHGMVYKGILSDQRVVAIKRSKDIEEGEISQFINEVAILSQINHRNIVKLYGCCLETEVPLLVYDFISNGSLFGILHSDPSSSFSLSWDDSLRIAAEAAGALYYLHSAASISVFHRDVKSSNILLDSNYTAKVSDFGASRLVRIDQTHVVTNVQGTFGYLDPEYYHTGQLNEKSDVYSFGVVLLELLLRREPIFTSETGSKQNLSNYFLWELKARPIKEIVATQVREEATEEEINSVASLAEMCLRLNSSERPTMKQVEMNLQFLRTKRSNSCHVVQDNNEEMQSLLCARGESRYETFEISLGESYNSDSCYGQGFNSFERDFESSPQVPS
ncbi:hypothetical protein HU200_001232 [Digitaria exilis]|uniref:Protein kinase domain-containing protein n=1 Tax=Digitaria exilis TaxID=1010633 RepID=A0A835G0M0_9POAL|nr:hypothetical protein HU200_001232 [Digitaria exilis]